MAGKVAKKFQGRNVRDMLVALLLQWCLDDVIKILSKISFVHSAQTHSQYKGQGDKGEGYCWTVSLILIDHSDIY